MPICKLCTEDKKLIKAHIVPRAFFLLPPPTQDAAKAISDNDHPKRVRDGIYDMEILCGECDGKLGLLDQHAAEHLLQKGTTGKVELGRTTFGHFYETADPEILRKFVASVAWRASISNHYFFRVVKLGRYEELIRGALLGINDLDPIDVVLGEFDKDGAAMLNPHRTRFGDINFWVIYASKFIFYLKVDQGRCPPDFTAYKLQKDQKVAAVLRSWMESRERDVMVGLARRNPNAFRRPNL
jgi:hypothetical protein